MFHHASCLQWRPIHRLVLAHVSTKGQTASEQGFVNHEKLEEPIEGQSSIYCSDFTDLLSFSSITASLLCTESMGHGSTELAPTIRKQMANADVKMDDVTLFLCVALTNMLAVYVSEDGVMSGPGSTRVLQWK